jgi:anthranilate 1,2-dioxygenase large subunit
MQTIWPNLIVQRELNTLGVRHIVPRGPDEFLMIWTMFGYEGDSEEMTRHRLRQGNLMGPAGFLGIEDNEAMRFVQQGMERSRSEESVVALGGSEEGTTEHIITEAAIRSLYRHYRDVMDL